MPVYPLSSSHQGQNAIVEKCLFIYLNKAFGWLAFIFTLLNVYGDFI